MDEAGKEAIAREVATITIMSPREARMLLASWPDRWPEPSVALLVEASDALMAAGSSVDAGSMKWLLREKFEHE